LKNLKILNLMRNRFTDIVDEILLCKSLVVLDMSYNEISYMPDHVCIKLNKMMYLNLYSNNITAISEEIQHMKNLRELNLGKNKLPRIPSEFGKLTKLTRLILNDNY